MTTAADEQGSDGRCSMPGCRRRADGQLCDEHRGGYTAIAAETLPHLQVEAKKRLVTSTGGSDPRPMTKPSEAVGTPHPSAPEGPRVCGSPPSEQVSWPAAMDSHAPWSPRRTPQVIDFEGCP